MLAKSLMRIEFNNYRNENQYQKVSMAGFARYINMSASAFNAHEEEAFWYPFYTEIRDEIFEHNQIVRKLNERK